MPDKVISIITACYNHGIYLDEAYASIQLDKYSEVFEHIIVNDGSTDAFTLQKLKELEQKGVRVIHQPNSGLAKARNAGIVAAEGRYILPLDSDNKLEAVVFVKAAQLLDQHADIAAVYTNAQYFGSRNDFWKVGELDVYRLLDLNYIDACALFRKTAIVEAGGYDESMPFMGNEDWELWINLLSRNKKIIYLQELGFYYRVLANSMSATQTVPGYIPNKAYIFKKHALFVSECFAGLLKRAQWAETRFEALQNRLMKNRILSVLKIILGRKFY